MSETSNRGPRHGRQPVHSRRRGASDHTSPEGIDPQRLAELDREEPLSIAEELTNPTPTSTSLHCRG